MQCFIGGFAYDREIGLCVVRKVVALALCDMGVVALAYNFLIKNACVFDNSYGIMRV